MAGSCGGAVLVAATAHDGLVVCWQLETRSATGAAAR